MLRLPSRPENITTANKSRRLAYVAQTRNGEHEWQLGVMLAV